MITVCDCPGVEIRHIAQSDKCILTRCSCGQYWIQLDIDPTSRPASPAEAALAEMVAALARLKLPAPVVGHRVPGGRNGAKV